MRRVLPLSPAGRHHKALGLRRNLFEPSDNSGPHSSRRESRCSRRAARARPQVLARRFVALLAGDIAGIEPALARGANADAITFTEKATYDMKRRIAQVLDKELAIAEGERAARLGRARRLPPSPASLDYPRLLLPNVRENPGRGRDSTRTSRCSTRTRAARCWRKTSRS